MVEKEKDSWFKDVDRVCIGNDHWLNGALRRGPYGLRGFGISNLHSVHDPMTDLATLMGMLLDAQGGKIKLSDNKGLVFMGRMRLPSLSRSPAPAQKSAMRASSHPRPRPRVPPIRYPLHLLSILPRSPAPPLSRLLIRVSSTSTCPPLSLPSPLPPALPPPFPSSPTPIPRCLHFYSSYFILLSLVFFLSFSSPPSFPSSGAGAGCAFLFPLLLLCVFIYFFWGGKGARDRVWTWPMRPCFLPFFPWRCADCRLSGAH
ncbi:hypothetical protein C8J57DRAFT_221715 [Mycena rebaudengoi]|nr:hypothetical protein C8J57DRAFT_221715 [Mycena rebaudengoi]